MKLSPVVIISLAAVLLASQIAVIIALVVLYKKFKTLKQEVHKYKVKKNRESLSGLIVKDPKEKKRSLDNEYVDGKRHPNTMVRTNSKESIVYVPTPGPERRSKNFGDQENGFELNALQSSGEQNVSYKEATNASYHEEDEVYGNQVVIDMMESSGKGDQTHCAVSSMVGSGNDPSTPCIEEVNINSGYSDDTDEIYGNQAVIDMVESSAADSNACSDEQNTSNVNTARKATKTKKNTTKVVSKKVKSQKLKTSLENENTTEAGGSLQEGDNTEVNNEPIYENLREQIKSTDA